MFSVVYSEYKNKNNYIPNLESFLSLTSAFVWNIGNSKNSFKLVNRKTHE
jgi:hypothetical protein